VLIAATISAILSNLFIAFFIIAIVTTVVKVRRVRLSRRPINVSYVLWGELLFYSVGLGMLWAGLFHAYGQQTVAPMIGWQPSPFEYELGWAEIGLAVVALLSLWRGTEFRLAATIIFVIFSFAAAAQHIAQIRFQHNYAPFNAGLVLWFGDIVLPLLLLILAFNCRDEELRRY
jgi:hypothetical protein